MLPTLQELLGYVGLIVDGRGKSSQLYRSLLGQRLELGGQLAHGLQLGRTTIKTHHALIYPLMSEFF